MLHNEFPPSLVQMTVSRIAHPNGSPPLRRDGNAQVGILFKKRDRRFIVGVSPRDNGGECRRIDDVCGVGNVIEPLRTRKSLSMEFETKLRGFWAKKWTLLGVSLKDGETPGWTSSEGCFFSASCRPFANLHYGDLEKCVIAPGEHLGILGTRSGLFSMAPVDAILRRRIKDTPFIALNVSDDNETVFEGVPVLNSNGDIFALALYGTKMDENSRQLLCILLDELLSSYGPIIEESLT